MIRQNSPKNKKIGVLSGYSKEELLRMIDEEVGKPEKEIDAELVNACVEAALLKDHESLPGCEAEMPSAEPCVIKFRNAQSTRKKRKRRTIIALAACVSILAAVFLTPISSYAFNFSILDTIATWYRDKVAVKTGNLNSSQQEIYTEEEVRQALADEGIENVLLPHYETDKYKITIPKIERSEISTDVSIKYLDENNKVKISCFIAIFSSHTAMETFNLQGRYPSGTEKEINGRKVLLIASKDILHVVFADDLIHYDIACGFDMETAEKLVETIY